MTKCYLLVLCLVICSINGSPLSNQFGIFGGQDAKEGQFPYQVSLQKCKPLSGCKHDCGAAVISPNWIVTAGHCFDGLLNDLQIVAGILKLSENSEYTQIRSVVECYVNEDYIGDVNPNDIAVMRLNESLVFNDRVQPIALPSQDFVTTGDVVATGWGQSRRNLFSQNPDTLQFLISNMPDEDTCLREANAKQQTPYNVTANVCTENPEANHGICYGDSGGPLVKDSQLVGLASWVFVPCGQKDKPSVFTRVSHFSDWIKKYVKDI